jgi:1-acyl-sn-glycerol-3-phosphate acyltransferase
MFLHLLCRVRIEGGEHIPVHGGVLLASNHLSMLDTLLIPYSVMAIQGMHIVWAPSKAELFRLPLLRHILASWGAFPVQRGRSDLRAIRRVITHMRTAQVMLFPEGTRSRDGRLGVGQRTVGKFIYMARPVVIPTAVWGTDRVLPPGQRWPRFRTPIGVRYGKPLDLQQYYDLPDTKETAMAIIGEVMRAIATLLPVQSPTATAAASGMGMGSQGSHRESANA